MPILSRAAQCASLANDYGDTRGPNAPASFEVALFSGDPNLGGVEISSTTVVTDEDTGDESSVANGYAPVTFANNGTNFPPANSATGIITTPVVTFPVATAAYPHTVTHWLLRAAGVGWDTGALPTNEFITVEAAGVIPQLSLAIYYNTTTGVPVTPADTPPVDPPVDPDPPAPGTTLFAGHIPLRVLVGIASPDDGSAFDPGWTEAQTIIGQDIYEARRFAAGNYTSGDLDDMLADADGADAFGVISFKYSNWAGVAAGDEDTDLIALCNYAKARRTAGGAPFGMSFHHEPAGDGDLADWAAMQEYCSHFFAGRRGGTASSTYVSADDVRDIMPWMPVGNGFWWRTASLWPPVGSDANTAYPQSLIDALRNNGGALLADFYDADYANQAAAMTNATYRTPGSGTRTSARFTQFITWARAKGAGAIGCGEFGVIDGTELAATWAVMRANRDIFTIANYFDSSVNSDHEWRLIPSTYGTGNPTGSKGLVDLGGNAQSQGRLDAFQTMLTESISSTYTT